MKRLSPITSQALSTDKRENSEWWGEVDFDGKPMQTVNMVNPWSALSVFTGFKQYCIGFDKVQNSIHGLVSHKTIFRKRVIRLPTKA